MDKGQRDQPRRRPGRPLKSDPDSPGAIRRAALAVFARQGFEGASIAAIARAAGVARPLIHYHFASKEELWRAALAEAFQAMQAEVAAVARTVASSPGPVSLTAVAGPMVRFVARYADLVRIVMDETGREGERADWLRDAYLTPMYRLAAAVLKQLRVPGDPAHLTPLVFGAASFAFLDAPALKAAFGVDVFDDAYVERHARSLEDWLADGLTGAPKPPGR